MAAGLIPTEGVGPTLLELLGAVPTPTLPWQMLLWQNDFLPTVAVTLVDLVECDFAGYNRLTLLRENWQTPTVSAGCAHSTWGTDPVVWDVVGGPVQTVFGYAYVEMLTGVLRFVQRFDDDDLTPILIPGTVSVLPEYTLTSAEC